MKSRRLDPRLILAAASLLTACATSKATNADDAADRLRDQSYHTADRGSVVEELEKVELLRARQANTVLAYHRFLEEFPSGDESLVAQSLLEELRFQEAKKLSTSDGWEVFIEQSPRGKHLEEARLALGALEIDRALASSDLSLVHHTLGRFPDHPKREALTLHEDQLAFSQAVAKGDNGSLDGYLALHPNGTHRVDAFRARERNDDREIEESEDLDRAQARVLRADAGERQRAIVAEVQLRRALRTLSMEALQRLAHTATPDAAVAAVEDRARAFLKSLDRHPFSKKERDAIHDSRTGAGLPSHEAVAAAIFNGDPIDRVAALRELVEWADPEDVRTFLSALNSEYLPVQLEAVLSLRALAQALKPAIWHAVDRAREDELMTHELTAAAWKQTAALREADCRVPDAVAAWHEVVSLDVNSVTPRARLFALAQMSGDRMAIGATARDLASSVTQFAEGRWQPPTPGDSPDRPPPGKGRVFGISGAATVLRQICVALELGGQAVQALGTLSIGAGAQEQELLSLARSDTERALGRIRGKETEIEETLHRDVPALVPCGVDPAAPIIAASRKLRATAIAELARSNDARLLPFVEGLGFSPAAEVRAAAAASAEALRSTAVAAHE